MIHAYVLNGYASSFRETRTSHLVRRLLEESGAEHTFEAHRALLMSSRSRKVRQRVQRRASTDVSLLLVGKSLGARNMVERVVNRMGPVRYRGIYLITIDPCWPECWDWTPNLNYSTLRIERFVDRAVNIRYVTRDPREQAGAMLCGPKGIDLTNEIVTDANHFTIVEHPVTRRVIQEMIEHARGHHEKTTV